MLAVAALLATLEGAHRVWRPLEAGFQELKARLGELETPEAKRAYLDHASDELRAIKDEIDSEEFADAEAWNEEGHQNRLSLDLGHCENEIRAELRRVFGRDAARRFDSNDEGTSDYIPILRDQMSEYVERRLVRLGEIKDGL